jgi:uncharacterized membrane protein YhaH (DUF805 family)
MGIGQMLFSGKGRIRRRDYWIWAIVLTLTSAGLQYLAYRLLGTHDSYLVQMASVTEGRLDNFSYVYFALVLLMQWPLICLNAKRWHDRGRPGIIAGFLSCIWIGYIGVTYAKAHIVSPYMGAIWIGFNIIYYVAAIWSFIECGCLDGTKGRNKYGPSTKGIGEEANVF